MSQSPLSLVKRVKIYMPTLMYFDVCGLRSPSFESSSVLYISPTDTSSMQNLILEGLQQKLQNPVLVAIRTLGTPNRAIYCNLQNTCFSLLIDLDTLIIISPKIDAP